MDQPALLGSVFKSGCARSRLTLLHKKQTTTVIMKFLDFELSGVLTICYLQILEKQGLFVSKLAVGGTDREVKKFLGGSSFPSP